MNNNSSLSKAIIRGDINQLNELLANGFDPNGFDPRSSQQNYIRATPLMTLSLRNVENSIDILNLLLDTPGIDINLRGPRNNTALSWAAAYSRSRIIKKLLDAGAYINHINDDGNSPLMMAAAQGNALTVMMLLKNNADTTIRNKYNKCALDIAKYRMELVSINYSKHSSKVINIYGIIKLLEHYRKSTE